MDFYKIVSDICDKRNITLCSLLSQLEMSKANIRNWRNGVKGVTVWVQILLKVNFANP